MMWLTAIGVLIVLAFASLRWFVNWLWQREIARLAQPDWGGVHRELGAVHIPQALRSLYENQALIQQRDFAVIDSTDNEARDQVKPPPHRAKGTNRQAREKRRKKYLRKLSKAWPIGHFYPAHPSTLRIARRHSLPPGSFTFAHDLYHTYYVILNTDPADDPPVYVLFNDDNFMRESLVVAPALSAFLSWKRRKHDRRTGTIIDLN